MHTRGNTCQLGHWIIRHVSSNVAAFICESSTSSNIRLLFNNRERGPLLGLIHNHDNWLKPFFPSFLAHFWFCCITCAIYFTVFSLLLPELIYVCYTPPLVGITIHWVYIAFYLVSVQFTLSREWSLSTNFPPSLNCIYTCSLLLLSTILSLTGPCSQYVCACIWPLQCNLFPECLAFA